MQFDVVVVGSGGGALTGAYLAQVAGLRTVVVERAEVLGGTSAYSGGACWLPGSVVQQAAGLPDSTDGAAAYLNALLPSIDAVKRDAFLARSPELVNQLNDVLAFEWLPFPEYFEAPGRVPWGRSLQPGAIERADLSSDVAALIRPPVERDRVGGAGRRTLTGGQALIARLAQAFKTAGGTFLTGVAVDEFVVEADRVTGVRGRRQNSSGHDGVEVRASRGVLVGAGGFERNDALRDRYGVPGRAEWSMAPAETNHGETLIAAERIGAELDLMDEGWFCPGVLQPDGSGSFTLGFRGGIIVDQAGRRYANECLPYDRFGRAMAESAERTPSYLIFDSSEAGALPAIVMPDATPSEHLAAGTWRQADSLAELAASLSLPHLVATLDDFNRDAATGSDTAFGRGQDEYDTFFANGSGPNKALNPVSHPPFYAATMVLSDLGTKGGIATDEAGRALRNDGTAIAGLYVTSNSAASMTQDVYPAPGAPLGTAMVFAALAIDDVLGGPADLM